MDHFNVKYTSEYCESQQFLFDINKLSREQRTATCFYPNRLTGEEHIRKLIAYQRSCNTMAGYESSDDDVIYCPQAPVKPRDKGKGPMSEADKVKWKNRQRALQIRLEEADPTSKRGRLAIMEKEFASNEAQDVRLMDNIEHLRGDIEEEEREGVIDLTCYESIEEDQPVGVPIIKPMAWMEGPNGEKIIVDSQNLQEAIVKTEWAITEVNDRKLKAQEEIAKMKARMDRVSHHWFNQHNHDMRVAILQELEEYEWGLRAEINDLEEGLQQLVIAKRELEKL